MLTKVMLTGPMYSCLENPMDRGAWWAAVHRVTKSWTRLKQRSTHRAQRLGWRHLWEAIIQPKNIVTQDILVLINLAQLSSKCDYNCPIFPDGSAVKNLHALAGDAGVVG